MSSAEGMTPTKQAAAALRLVIESTRMHPQVRAEVDAAVARLTAEQPPVPPASWSVSASDGTCLSPAPVPEGMETTPQSRALILSAAVDRPDAEAVRIIALLRDLDRALAEIARLTAINADLCAVNLRHAEESARITELEAERDQAERERFRFGALNKGLSNRIAELEAERDKLKATLTKIATTADIGLNIGPVIRCAQAALVPK